MSHHAVSGIACIWVQVIQGARIRVPAWHLQGLRENHDLTAFSLSSACAVLAFVKEVLIPVKRGEKLIFMGWFGLCLAFFILTSPQSTFLIPLDIQAKDGRRELH